MKELNDILSTHDDNLQDLFHFIKRNGDEDKYSCEVATLKSDLEIIKFILKKHRK